ncbi:hypothetical protein ACFW20_19380 [Streptomyces nigra]
MTRLPAGTRRLYDGLTASGDCLVVVFAYDGMPIAADFDIGDDW